jgi:S1-C subfamily serine protease
MPEEGSMEVNPKPRLIQALLPGIAMVEDLSCAGSRRIVGQNIVGTAFLANVHGYFLTANHVVQGRRAEEIKMRTTYSPGPGGGYAMSTLAVDAIYPHPLRDIAVLAVRKQQPATRVALRMETGNLAVGSDILLVGYATGTDLVFCDEILGIGSPKSYSPVAFAGMICARVPDDDRSLELLAYDCSTFGGNSGAPVVSIDSGKIVALHLRGFEHHVGYGIPIDLCTEFLTEVVQIHEAQKARRRDARKRRCL